MGASPQPPPIYVIAKQASGLAGGGLGGGAGGLGRLGGGTEVTSIRSHTAHVLACGTKDWSPSKHMVVRRQKLDADYLKSGAWELGFWDHPDHTEEITAAVAKGNTLMLPPAAGAYTRPLFGSA